MAQNEIPDFVVIDNDNTDIHGTTIVQNQMYPYMVDNAFRNLAGMLKRFSISYLTLDNISLRATAIASAATTNIGAAQGQFVHITGTTTITSLGTIAAGVKRELVFDGILTLTHNATTLILPTGANIITAVGDSATAISEGGGNWRVDYRRASGAALGPSPLSATVLDTLRNRVVNGDKLVSQENSQTSGTTNGRYISDQNAMYFVSSAGTFTGVNVQTLSPAGGYRDRITISVADAALAAGEFLTYTQNIEGSNIRDAKWGTAGAVPIVVRRGFRFPGGTYTVAFHNSGATRSYVTSFTISAPEANTDVVRTFLIPGDTAGTWLNGDGVIGLTMDVVIAAGTTFQTTANTWQGGNFLTIAGTTNGMGAAAAIYEFFDEGIRLDPNSTGVYGNYQVGPTDAVYRPERYAYSVLRYMMGSAQSITALYRNNIAFPVRMAKVPTLGTASYATSTGNPGTPDIDPTAAWAPTEQAVSMRNSGASWTVGAFVVLTGIFLARL